MSIDCMQLKQYIILPALTALGLYSESAVKLLLGTCAQETGLGTFLVQKGIGFNGASGIYQMENASYNFIYDSKISSSNSMRSKIKLYLGYESKPPFERMASDLALSTIIARLYYLNVKENLPLEDDISGMANYWKKYWNTIKGKGTVEQFIENYRKYVTC